MFILIGIIGPDGNIFKYDDDHVKTCTPEVVKYIDIMTKNNRTLRLLDNKRLNNNSTYSNNYILIPSAIPNFQTSNVAELFNSITAFENKYKDTSEYIYIISDPTIHNSVLHICDILMITTIDKSPKTSISIDNNEFILTNSSLELVSMHKPEYKNLEYTSEITDPIIYKYQHLVYTKCDINSVLLL